VDRADLDPADQEHRRLDSSRTRQEVLASLDKFAPQHAAFAYQQGNSQLPVAAGTHDRAHAWVRH
jgi:hypothetical protein